MRAVDGPEGLDRADKGGGLRAVDCPDGGLLLLSIRGAGGRRLESEPSGGLCPRGGRRRTRVVYAPELMSMERGPLGPLGPIERGRTLAV